MSESDSNNILHTIKVLINFVAANSADGIYRKKVNGVSAVIYWNVPETHR
jgi:hypothetical protein